MNRDQAIHTAATHLNATITELNTHGLTDTFAHHAQATLDATTAAESHGATVADIRAAAGRNT